MRDCITGSIIWCCKHLSSFTILEKLYIFPALSSPSPSPLRLLHLWLGQCRDQLVRHPQPEKWHGGLRSPPWLSIIAVKNICDCRGEYPFTDRLFNSNTDCAMGMPDSFKISHTCRFFWQNAKCYRHDTNFTVGLNWRRLKMKASKVFIRQSQNDYFVDKCMTMSGSDSVLMLQTGIGFTASKGWYFHIE